MLESIIHVLLYVCVVMVTDVAMQQACSLQGLSKRKGFRSSSANMLAAGIERLTPQALFVQLLQAKPCVVGSNHSSCITAHPTVHSPNSTTLAHHLVTVT